jgi:hypothetical protein
VKTTRIRHRSLTPIDIIEVFSLGSRITHPASVVEVVVTIDDGKTIAVHAPDPFKRPLTRALSLIAPLQSWILAWLRAFPSALLLTELCAMDKDGFSRFISASARTGRSRFAKNQGKPGSKLQNIQTLAAVRVRGLVSKSQLETIQWLRFPRLHG